MPIDRRRGDSVLIGPVHVLRRTRAAALGELGEALGSGHGVSVAFANTHLIYAALRDNRYAALLRTFYVLNDGIGVEALARLVDGRGFHDNLNGTDFVPALLAAAPPGTRLFLVGASRPVVVSLAEKWNEAFPHVRIVGFTDGYQGSEVVTVAAAIGAARPDLVLVAMGNPRQEKWINKCRALAPGPVYIGVGALFDYAAGAVARAPPLVRRARAEWLYRFYREPGRLWRRYTIEAVVVAANILGARLAQQRRSAP